MALKVKNGIVEDEIIGPSQDYDAAPLAWDAVARVVAPRR